MAANYVVHYIVSHNDDNEQIDCCTKYSGITREDLDNGIPYAAAIGNVKALLGGGAIVVGHTVQSDFNALQYDGSRGALSKPT